MTRKLCIVTTESGEPVCWISTRSKIKNLARFFGTENLKLRISGFAS